MKLRLLEKKDIKECGKIVRKNYDVHDEKLVIAEMKDMWSKGSFRPTYFVAEEKGKIIGFAGYIQSWIDYSVYNIFWVNVLQEEQKRGVGQIVVKKIISEIKKHKNAKLIILSASTRRHNDRYYKKHFGFKIIQKFGTTSHALMSLEI